MSSIGADVPTKPVFTPPILKSAFQTLPQELRMVMMRNIATLNKAIELLLHSKGEAEFEYNLARVTLEYFQYYESLIQDMNEKDLQLLFERSYNNNNNTSNSGDINGSGYGSGVGETQSQTQAQTDASSLEQTFDYIVEVSADFTKLISKDHDILVNHQGLAEQYKDLMVYSCILNYINNNNDNDKDKTFDQSMVKKILRRCQESASAIESYTDGQDSP